VARGINPEGDIVGTCAIADIPPIHGFLLSGGVFATIDLTGFLQTIPSGINSRGDIVGTYSIPIGIGGGASHGFLMSK